MKTLGSLMDRNFDQRKKLYSEKVIGQENLKMIQLARDNGFAAAFTGSGGAINCLYLGDTTTQATKKRKHEENPDPTQISPAEEDKLAKLFHDSGFHFERARIRTPSHEPTFSWDC